ncbi:MAG: tetratricopeptide repeat protein, partial [Chloroflexota bacterium]
MSPFHERLIERFLHNAKNDWPRLYDLSGEELIERFDVYGGFIKNAAKNDIALDDAVEILIEIVRVAEKKGYLNLFEELISMTGDLNDRTPQQLVHLRNRAGQISRFRNEHKLALIMHRSALDIAEQNDDQFSIAESHFYLGESYYFQNDIVKAWEHTRYAESFLKNELKEATYLEASFWILKGNIKIEHQDYEEAIGFFEIAENIFMQLGSKIGVSRSLTNRGLAYFYQRKYDEALDLFTKAKSLLSDNNFEMAQILNTESRVWIEI